MCLEVTNKSRDAFSFDEQTNKKFMIASRPSASYCVVQEVWHELGLVVGRESFEGHLNTI